MFQHFVLYKDARKKDGKDSQAVDDSAEVNRQNRESLNKYSQLEENVSNFIDGFMAETQASYFNPTPFYYP